MRRLTIDGIIVTIAASVLLVALFFSLPASDPAASSTPITGQATHPMYGAFSVPEAGFRVSGGLVSVTDTALHKMGWYSVNGTAWQQFTFTGSAYGTGSTWLSGSASASLPAALSASGEHYLIVYSCSYNNSWDCHGNKWQLMVIAAASPSSCSDGVENGDETSIDCGGGCPACFTGNTYYVSLSGSDSDPGTMARPFQTLAYAESKMRGGDRLYVRGGTYFERLVVMGVSGNASSRTVFRAYPGERVIVDGQNEETDVEGDVIRVYDEYVDVYGFEIQNVNQDGAVGNKGTGVQFQKGHNTISHCTIHDTWNNGITAIGDYNSIEYCEIYNTSLMNRGAVIPVSGWGAGATMRYDEGGAGTTADHCVFRHNVVHDIWGEGLSFAWSTNGTMEDNVVYDTYSALLYMRNSRNMLMQRNLCYMTKSMAGAYPSSSVGIAIWDESYDLPVDSDIAIINNVVYGCETNFYTTKQENISVIGNTFVDSTYQTNVQIGSGGLDHVKGYFVNNIVVQNNQAIGMIIVEGNHPERIYFNNNLWSRALWRSYEIPASGANDVIGDSLFTESTDDKNKAAYYTLSGSSPAIGAGVYVVSAPRDYAGDVRGNPPDIGAFEYRG